MTSDKIKKEITKIINKSIPSGEDRMIYLRAIHNWTDWHFKGNRGRLATLLIGQFNHDQKMLTEAEKAKEQNQESQGDGKVIQMESGED